MKTQLAVLAAVSLLVFSYSYVYAERATIEVPFDYNDWGCYNGEPEGTEVFYFCKFTGSSETVTKEAIQNSGVIPEEQLTEERKEAHEVAKAQEEKEDKPTPTERKIAELEAEVESGEISAADLILLKALKNMDRVCSLGIEHGALIQQYAEFEIPVIAPSTIYKSIDFDKNTALGKIIKKTIECEMWDEYRVSHLGQRYLDIVVDDSTTQPHHSAVATTDEVFPSQKLTHEDFKETLTNAEKLICESNYFDRGFKKQSGCYPEPNPTGGEISMADNPAMKKYTAWKDTGSQSLADLKRAEVERAQQESLDSFAQRHGIDVSELKNLVQGDKP